jgi:nitroimidazol reductase NimA-like FMN-containing flavoprotein (pyridoxamine 5'-phosphate oxidase superfamily)
MDYTSLQQAEQEYNRKLEIDFVNMLKGSVYHPDPDELRSRLVKFLRNNAIGTLATCYDDLPRATPVRYKSKDVDIYILTEGGGKIFNIRRNPSVSFSIHGRYAGFTTCRCVQLWGQASIIEQDDADYDRAYDSMGLGKRADLSTVDLKAVQASMCIIKIVPQRARILNLPVGILNAEISFT